jgi:ketosteroid isomerase-like protein
VTTEADAEAISVAVRFNACINDRDLAGLAELMPNDHRFVDSAEGVVAGKPACLAAWRGFFNAFPDYRNVFSTLSARGDVVTIVGHSVCAEPNLAGPALWTATVRDGQVAEWRVFEDTPQARRLLNL